MGVVEDWQFQFLVQCQYVGGKVEQQCSQYYYIVVVDVMLQSNIEYGCGKGDFGIQFFLEDQWNVFVEYIVQYVVEDIGDYGGNRGDNWVFVYVQGDLCVDDGKYDQFQCVQYQKQLMKVWYYWSGNGCENGGDGDNDDIFGMFYLIKRIVFQQDIVNGIFVQCGCCGDNNDVKCIYLLVFGSQCVGYGFCGDID